MLEVGLGSGFEPGAVISVYSIFRGAIQFINLVRFGSVRFLELPHLQINVASKVGIHLGLRLGLRLGLGLGLG